MSPVTPSARTAPPPARLLVIDDEAPLRQVFQKMFEDLGYEVDQAADGSEGWNMVQARPYDLVVTDMNMPNMEGTEFIDLAKDKYPEMEIILMSGFKELANAGSSVKHGAYDFIAKPFHAEDLIRLVGHALEKRRVNLLFSQVADLKKPAGAVEKAMSSGSLAIAQELLDDCQALLNSGLKDPEQDARVQKMLTSAQSLLARAKPNSKIKLFL